MHQKTKLLIEQLVYPLGNYKNQSDTQLRNYFYQSILFILEYIFSDKQVQPQKVEIDQKQILVHYIEKFKTFVDQKKDERFLQITNKLIGQRYEQLTDEQEGFISSDDEKKRVNVVSSVFQNLFETSEYTKQHVQQMIKQKDNQIIMLSQLIKQRDNTIIDLAHGYLKDTQNMRDQMFRSEIQEDYFDIQYFDIGIIEDVRYKDLFNQKISHLKSSFEMQMRKMTESMKKSQEIIQNQSQEIQNLERKTSNLQNVEYLVERIFFLEKNPYQIWKLIQDAVGCKFFYEVFENQKESSGIDYKEVNKMLMSSKAYEREFAYFKKSVEDQMVIYLERAIDVINKQDGPQSEILDNMLIELTQQKEVNSYLQQEIDKLNDNYQVITKMRILEQEINVKAIKDKTVKRAFLVWKIINQQFNKDRLEQNSSRKSYSDLLYNKQMKIELYSLQLNSLQKEVELTKQNHQLLKLNYEDQVQMRKICKRDNDELMVTNKNYQNCLQKIFNYLNIKLQVNQQTIQDNENGIKKFEERINSVLIQKYGAKVIQELIGQQQKNNLALIHLKPTTNEMFTQTIQNNHNKQVKPIINEKKIQDENQQASIVQNRKNSKSTEQGQTDIQRKIEISPQAINQTTTKRISDLTMLQQQVDQDKKQTEPIHREKYNYQNFELNENYDSKQEMPTPKLMDYKRSQQSQRFEKEQKQIEDYSKSERKTENKQQININQQQSSIKGSEGNDVAFQQTRSLNISREILAQQYGFKQSMTPHEPINLEEFQSQQKVLYSLTPQATTRQADVMNILKSQQFTSVNRKLLKIQKKLNDQQTIQLFFLQKLVFQSKHCLSYAKEQFYLYIQFYQKMIDKIKHTDLKCTNLCKQYLNQKNKIFDLSQNKSTHLDNQKVDKSLRIDKIVSFQFPPPSQQIISDRQSNKNNSRQTTKYAPSFKVEYVKKQRAYSTDQKNHYKHQFPQL